MTKKSFVRFWQCFVSDLDNMPIFVLLSSTTISFAICLFVFFVIPGNHAYSPQIAGTEQTCEDEGQSVSLQEIPYMKCFDCTCKNGLVECVKRNCPSNNGCYLLRALQRGECCQKCKGCIKNKIYYESGTEWTEPRNPCRSFTCIAGVITEAPIRCYTPCSNPIPPVPGQCCPTCPVCHVNKKYIVNKTQIMPEEDPCVTCVCSSEKLLCTKKTCPVLNCPEEKIVQGVDECCPQCLGTGRYLDPPEGFCILGKTIRRSGMQFTLDECTQCDCQNSTLLCEKKSCPILHCKKEHQKILRGRCCAHCERFHDEDEIKIESHEKEQQIINENDNEDKDEIEDKINDKVEHEDEKKETEHKIIDAPIKPIIMQLRSCTYDDATYKDGETWNTTTCETCTCIKGRANCSVIMCPAISCPPNTMLKIHEGECCPICEGNQGVCTVTGGTHFRTFDDKMYAFLGSCKYQLASDCDSGTFNIRLKNTVTENNAAIKRISVKLGNVRVDLQQNKNTKVNDEVIDLPYELKNKLEINVVDENVVISSKMGIKVLWNYVGFLEVTVPKNYRKKLCGLCGNFNSIANDDLTTREGISTEDPAIFAQSWTAGEEICLETRNYGVRGCNPNKDKRLCSYIKGSIFSKCLKKINVESYYETCLKDMCECAPDDLQCHCESFASYVRDCQRLGILLPRWRKSVGC